nr:hypothetical protein HK105_007371 [Polyrhizophydium stewartii]
MTFRFQRRTPLPAAPALTAAAPTPAPTPHAVSTPVSHGSRASLSLRSPLGDTAGPETPAPLAAPRGGQTQGGTVGSAPAGGGGGEGGSDTPLHRAFKPRASSRAIFASRLSSESHDAPRAQAEKPPDVRANTTDTLPSGQSRFRLSVRAQPASDKASADPGSGRDAEPDAPSSHKYQDSIDRTQSPPLTLTPPPPLADEQTPALERQSAPENPFAPSAVKTVDYAFAKPSPLTRGLISLATSKPSLTLQPSALDGAHQSRVASTPPKSDVDLIAAASARLGHQRAELERQLAAVKAERDEALKTAAEQARQIHALEVDASVVCAAAEAQRDAIATLEERIDAIKRTVKIFQSAVRRLEEQCRAATDKTNELETRLKAETALLQEASSRRDSLAAEVAELRGSHGVALESLLAKLQQASDQGSTLASELSQIREQMSADGKQRAEVHAQLQKGVEEAQNRLREAESRITVLSAEKAALGERISAQDAAAESARATSAAELAAALASADDWMGRAKKADEDCQRLRATVEQMHASALQSQRELSEARATLSDLESRLENRIQLLGIELERAHEEVEIQRKKQLEDNKQSSARISLIERERDDAIGIAKELETKHSDAVSQLDACERRIEQQSRQNHEQTQRLEAERDALSKKCEDQMRELADLESRMQARESALMAGHRQNDKQAQQDLTKYKVNAMCE